MQTIVADIETDGLLDVCTTVHSFSLECVETGERLSCADQPGYPKIKEALDVAFNEADRLVFHNGWGFDIPALKKIYPDRSIPINRCMDTLIMSRVMYPNISDIDVRQDLIPKNLYGSHSLEAWGHRLGKHKGDYAKEMGDQAWVKWNPEMQSYCDNDVVVTVELLKGLLKQKQPFRALDLENWFAAIIALQEEAGFPFDYKAAEALANEIERNRDKLDFKISQYVDSKYISKGEFVPKRDNKRQGYLQDVPLTKIELSTFEPNSRTKIAKWLTEDFDWVPPKYTDKGNIKVDEDTLATVTHPIGKLISDRFILEKRLGQIKTGAKGWLKLHDNGIMHGSMNTIGAVTGRCTHHNPNMGQIPSVGALYGKECRGLFHAPPGYVIVGCDASGLELRCLAHFMAKFDNGEYARILLEGDIHSQTVSALYPQFTYDCVVNGLECTDILINFTNKYPGSMDYIIESGISKRDSIKVKDYFSFLRSLCKTFIYGFLYGAGDAKIGTIVNGTAEDGKHLKTQFLNGLPALKQLRNEVAKQAKTGFLQGIDGRLLPVRHQHAALNTLLQSAGALLVKQATVNLFKELHARGLKWNHDWWMAAHVHDEYQLIVRKELEQEVSDVAEWAFRQAGKDFNWRCPLDGEAKIGKNWAETH